MHHGPSERLAAFVAEFFLDDVPDDAIDLVERRFVDTIGVALAGTAEPSGRIARSILEAGSGGATVWGSDATATAHDAAFANGTAGHALDFDDTSWTMTGHPSVTMIPAIVAVGETEATTGMDAVAAYVVGYETMCYLAEALGPSHNDRGWHGTATLGTFGTAAAISYLLDSDAEATRHALNVAASMAAGLTSNFGTMTKPLHAGNAARSGTTAALLAGEGFTAGDESIGGTKGFWNLYAGDNGIDERNTQTLGDELAITTEGIHTKKYPSCYFTHPSIAAAISIGAENDVGYGDVESIRATVSRGAREALIHDDPSEPLEGKFSLQYTIAHGLVYGAVDLAAFTEERLTDDAVDSVRSRVEFVVDPDLRWNTNEARIEVETTDGTVHEQHRTEAPGTADDPLSERELREKFTMCVEYADVGVDSGQAYEVARDLSSVEEVTELTATLS